MKVLFGATLALFSAATLVSADETASFAAVEDRELAGGTSGKCHYHYKKTCMSYCSKQGSGDECNDVTYHHCLKQCSQSIQQCIHTGTPLPGKVCRKWMNKKFSTCDMQKFIDDADENIHKETQEVIDWQTNKTKECQAAVKKDVPTPEWDAVCGTKKARKSQEAKKLCEVFTHSRGRKKCAKRVRKSERSCRLYGCLNKYVTPCTGGGGHKK
mmetsp:Transcript_21062/g.34391  ORF Transcript_21062/g.34391 Transcript_21062/m.34391 type:complete len:213 (-) Transcript_21062:8-646(-)